MACGAAVVWTFCGVGRTRNTENSDGSDLSRIQEHLCETHQSVFDQVQNILSHQCTVPSILRLKNIPAAHRLH